MQNVEDYDRGYHPTVTEPFPAERPHFLDRLPGAAIVNPAFLPPVGQQGTTASIGSPGTCCAWATVYGLATFTAASAGRVDPSVASGQASPAQIYIDVLKKKKTRECSCAGTSFGDYFFILLAAARRALRKRLIYPTAAPFGSLTETEKRSQGRSLNSIE
jgi:hypothetical protein